MKKVVVYGLGKGYQESKNLINGAYEVVALTDKNNELVSCYDIGIPLNQILDIWYDNIIITSVIYADSMIKTLEQYGIEKDKVLILQHLDCFRDYWKTMPLRGMSYSDSFEDLLIEDLLLKMKLEVSNIHYIELGVMDPVCASNTYFFYKKGASGYLVEANPHLIDIIKNERQRDTVINKAIYEGEATTISLYISDDIGLSSVDENHLNKSEEWSCNSIREKVEVETTTINEVFEQFYKEYGNCDLLSIDIEGYDFEALSALDFNKYKPTIIIAELNATTESLRIYYMKVVELLKEIGYRLYANNRCNGIFVYDK